MQETSPINRNTDHTLQQPNNDQSPHNVSTLIIIISILNACCHYKSQKTITKQKISNDHNTIDQSLPIGDHGMNCFNSEVPSCFLANLPCGIRSTFFHQFKEEFLDSVHQSLILTSDVKSGFLRRRTIRTDQNSQFWKNIILMHVIWWQQHD